MSNSQKAAEGGEAIITDEGVQLWKGYSLQHQEEQGANSSLYLHDGNTE